MQISALYFRKSYSIHNSMLPRLSAFIGTSNFRELLTDKTGSHRFICVSVDHSNAPYYRTFPIEELFLRCFRVPCSGEEGNLYSLTDLLFRIRQKCPGVTTGVNLQNFAQTLTVAGVRKIHTQYGNRYRVVEV